MELVENSIVVGAAAIYDKLYAEPSQFEIQAQKEARQEFTEALLKGNVAIGENGQAWTWYNLWEVCPCEVEIDHKEALNMWLAGQLTQYAAQVHKAADICADAAGWEELC